MQAANRFLYNLKEYLDSTKTAAFTVVRQDVNTDRDLPLVVVAWSGVDQTAPRLRGHYTIAGSVDLYYIGYDDGDNSATDTILQDIEEILSNGPAVATGVTAGTKTELVCNAFFLRGISHSIDGKTNIYSFEYEAFVRNFD